MAEREPETHLSHLLERVLGKHGETQARDGWRELRALASRAWSTRAVRRKAAIGARLRHADAPESAAVSAKILDISSSGARLSITREAKIDLIKADRMYLYVTVESADEAQVLGLFVSFVRVAAMEDDRAELAFRFAHPSEETRRKLDRIHAHYFSGEG